MQWNNVARAHWQNALVYWVCAELSQLHVAQETIEAAPALGFVWKLIN